MRLHWLLTGTEGKGGIAISSPTLYWRMLGALVLGVIFARWSWILFAPHAAAVAVVPEHSASAEAGRLFGVAVQVVPASDVSATEEAAASNMRLVGVFAGRVGHPGFAVLKLDEKRQVGVVVGENVIPGTKLLEAHPDYVLLEHSGGRQRVKLDVKIAASPAAGAAPAVNGDAKSDKD